MGRILLLLTGLSGCPTNKEETGVTRPTEDDSGPTTTVPDAESPVITGADASCFLHETGEQYWGWDVWATVEDPQGADSIVGGRVEIRVRGELVAEHLLACNGDDARCTTSFREEADGVLCADATVTSFRLTVTDEDDNVSDAVEVAGRQQ